MAKMVITDETPKFFALNGKIAIGAGVGAVFGVLAAFVGSWIHQFTCGRLAITRCLPDAVGTYRIGLVLLAVVALVALIVTRVERPLLIVIPSVIVLWNLFLVTPEWWRSVIYGLLGLLLFSLFTWMSRVHQWQVALIATAVTTIILVII